jgi:hypothetical protein
MFEVEKTRIFWVGLTISGLASTALFSNLWYSLVLLGDPSYFLKLSYELPFTLGFFVFILIGLYLMKCRAE